MESKPLLIPLDEFKTMLGKRVFRHYFEPDAEFHEEMDGFDVVEEFGVNCEGREIVCFENSELYCYLDNYGKTWGAYSCNLAEGNI